MAARGQRRWQATAPPVAGPLILLAQPGSGIERALVTAVAAGGGVRPSAVLRWMAWDLTTSLAADPAGHGHHRPRRVTWLPASATASGGSAGRRPVAGQPAPAARCSGSGPSCAASPAGAQMVVAEPATVAALRERWGGTGSSAHFVSRQATLALDRAERATLGYRYKVPKDVAEAIEDSPEYRADVAALATGWA